MRLSEQQGPKQSAQLQMMSHTRKQRHQSQRGPISKTEP